MILSDTLRADLGHLHGRRVSLAAPLPASRPSQIIIDLEPADWIDITVPAHIAAQAMKGATA